MIQVKWPCRIVVADDHTLFRDHLKRLLGENCNLQIVGETGSGCELLECLSSLPGVADLAIIDISMPNLGGIEAASRIRSAYPGIKILILSMHKEKQYFDVALAAGAHGYLLKENAADEIFPAIEKIRRGEVYISSQLSPAPGS